MSDKKRLEKAYRDLQIQKAPDLWNRIEAGLEAREENPADEKPVRIHVDKRKGRKKNYRFEAGIAAAACCALLAAGSLKFNRGAQSGAMETNAVMAEGTMAAETTAAAALEPQETLAQKAEVPSYGDYAEGQNEAVPGGTSEAGIVRYESLALAGVPAPVPPENSVFVPDDHYYFTEDSLKDAGLLSQVQVKQVSYEESPDGLVHFVIYDVVVDKVLYSEDYVSEKQELQVKSPLTGDGADLYLLKEGGNYILPLKYEDGAYRLVYPECPQIEVTEDTRYVFHTGWQSLVDDRTAVVLKSSESPEDYYYDRMVLRDDAEFLSNLTALVQMKREAGKKA